MARLLARNLVFDDANEDGTIREGTIPVFASATAIKAIAATSLFDGFACYDAATFRTYTYDAQANQANYATSVEPAALKSGTATGMFFVSGEHAMILIDPAPMMVLNNTAADIAQYSEVYVTDVDGATGLATIDKARANALGTVAVVRTTLTTIQAGKRGYVGKELFLTAQDTSTATGSGYGVYLDSAVAGARVFDPSAPTGGNSRYIVGRVVKKHAASGVIHIYHENRAEEHNHNDAARGTQLTSAGIAALGITADATGRGVFANGLWDSATVDLKFAAGAFGATVAARALFVANFIDAATWLDKVAVDAIVASSFSGAAKKFGAGSLVEAGITSLFGASAFTAAHFSGANIKFAASALDAAGLASFIGVNAFTTASMSGGAKKFAAGALDVAGTLSIFAANAFSEANVDAIFAAGGINGTKLKVASVAEDRMVGAQTLGLQTLRVAHGVFDASAGLAIGAYNLGALLPDNALGIDAFYKVRTTFASAADTATIALSVEAAGDLKVAIAISDASNPWDAAGRVKCTPDLATAANTKETTAARQLVATVAVQALTAGVMDVWCLYVVQNG